MVIAVIYGTDDSKPITPIMVRDSMVRCFIEAHCLSGGFDENEKSNAYCKYLVQEAFKKIIMILKTQPKNHYYELLNDWLNTQKNSEIK